MPVIGPQRCNLSKLEVGIGWLGRHEPARDLTRCSLRGLWDCHVQEILFRLAPARARLDGSWVEHPFPLFVSLKLSKIVKKNNLKHGSGPHEARAHGQNLEITGPTLTRLGPTRHFHKLVGRAREQARPSLCLCLIKTIFMQQ